MKKIFSIITVFLSVCLQGFAQQYINLYQDDVVIKQYSTEEIDSMSVSDTEPRIVSFWRDGDVFQTYNAADIDSIKVTNRGGAPLSYIGIVGFNSQLQTKDIGILSPSTASQYMSFVSNLPKRDGSILYYAVDNALDMLEDAHIESPLKSVNVITFTDGLDQGSLMMTDKYSSSAAYLNALGERIAQAKDSELSPNFYALGLRGSDVSDMSQFRQNLQRLASSADNVFEVSSISDLRSKFQDIANQIISVSTRQSMSVRVIGVETGTRMRFVFDGKTAATSELYIEGTFNLQDLSLHNVTYHGIKATSGKTVQGTQDGIFVTYTFTGMRLEAGTSLIPTASVKHYYMYPSSTSWQANSEFTPTGDTQRNVSHSGTLIFLVLDCSSSLGSDFSRMQQYANEFIDLIASNAEPYERLLPPTNVKASIDENDLVVNVSWDAVKYAQSYNVYRSSSSSGTYSLVAEGVTSTTWTDDSPLNGYNYYKVCAKNWNEASSQSSYASVTVSLAAPTNVKAELEVKDEKFVVNVSWNAVKYAQSYKVYRRSSSGDTYSLVAEGITSTTWIDDSPQKGYNYYKVCAVNRKITSSQSSYASVTVSLAAPTNVKAVIDENDLVVNISWNAVKYAESYNVYRTSSSWGTYSLVAEGITSTTWIDDSPQKGDNYYKVCAEGYGFTSSQSSYASVTVSLAAPTNVAAEIDENDLVVNVSWDAVKYAQSYKVYRSNSSSGTYSLVAEGVTSTTWKDESPQEGYNYYKVCAEGYGFTSSQSSYASVNVSLAAPTNVKAEVDVKDDNFVVNVSWDAVKYAQSYDVYRSSSSNGTYELVAENIPSTTWTDLTPVYGNSYYYKVYAKNRNVVSTQSLYSSVTVNLSAPTNIKAEIDENDLVVNVSWDAVKYAQSYKVYRSNSSSGTYSLVAEGVTSTTWKDESPQEGYNYYKVCAEGYGFTSSQSSYASVNVSLAAPTNVKAEVDVKDDNFVVNVSWDAVKYAQSYDVYRSSSSNGTYELVAENIPSTTWTDLTPVYGNSYYYKVYAKNRDVVSTQSPYASITVNIAAPTHVKAVIDENDLVVNVSWDAVKYAQSYKVYRSSSSSGTYSLVAEGVTSTTWTDSSPLSGSNYYKVCAVGYGFTSSSSYASVTVSLVAPTNVKAEIDENDLVVNVSWDAVKYAESYNVYRSSSFSGTYSLIAERVTSTSWTDSNPISGNNYYKVNAQYKDKISAFSNAVRALDPTKGSIITVNGVAFNMVKVSGGTFQMGATSEQGSDGNYDEEPVHQVTLSDYYIGETEVTQELWQAVMGSNPSYHKGSGQLPVDKVSWDDCQTFITKLNALTGMQFRLPTEAEWEFAARGGNSSQGYKYSGSNNIDDVAWYSKNSNSKPHEVGTKAPNELGLYDMSGNVWEWCQDWYGGYSSSAQTNPTGPTSGSYRVNRGCDYYNSASGCRVSCRGSNTPGNRYSQLGLRLAL